VASCKRRESWRLAIAALRQLLLMRHAKSTGEEPGLTDHARSLNACGRAGAAAMRGAMLTLGLAPDMVLVSSARRTMQTLHLLEPWDETPLIEVIDLLYLADLEALLGVLHAVPATLRSVMLIGHNPGMHELALHLVGAASLAQASGDARRLIDGYPTGALCEFTVPGAWAALAEGGARLQRFLAPRDLPSSD
jgi:phosphohistidine phosphatase